MSDYYSPEQQATKLGLTLVELEQAQAWGLISPVHNNGSVFYPSQHAYRLKAACQLRRKQSLSWEEAAAELSKRLLYLVSSRLCGHGGTRSAVSTPSDRWRRSVCAQEKLAHPFVLCRLVALRAQQLNNKETGILLAQAIDLALDEVARGLLAPPEGWLEQLGRAKRAGVSRQTRQETEAETAAVHSGRPCYWFRGPHGEVDLREGERCSKTGKQNCCWSSR